MILVFSRLGLAVASSKAAVLFVLGICIRRNTSFRTVHVKYGMLRCGFRGPPKTSSLVARGVIITCKCCLREHPWLVTQAFIGGRGTKWWRLEEETDTLLRNDDGVLVAMRRLTMIHGK
jgi:hypothetical protein